MNSPTQILLDLFKKNKSISLVELCNVNSKFRKNIKLHISKLNNCYRKDIRLEVKDKYLEYEEFFKSRDQSLSEVYTVVDNSLDQMQMFSEFNGKNVIDPYYLEYCINGVKFTLLSLRANKKYVCDFIRDIWKLIENNEYITYKKHKRQRINIPVNNATSKLYNAFFKKLDKLGSVKPDDYCNTLFETLYDPKMITMSLIELNILATNYQLCKSIFKS